MAQSDETLVALDGAWLRAETVDAARTFVAPFQAVVRAIERVSRPPSARPVDDGKAAIVE